MPSVGTGISAGLSLLSGKKASDSASSSRALQAAQLELQQERDAFNREQVEEMNKYAREDREDMITRRERARGLYDPLQESVLELAQEGPDYIGAQARSDADVAQSFAMQKDQARRESQRYGVNPGSGRRQAEQRRWGNAEALAKVYGRDRARRKEDDKDWSRRIAALGTGNVKNTNASTQLAQLGVSGASGVLGEQAASESANAAGGFALAGNLAADAVDYYKQSQIPKPAPGMADGWTDTYGYGVG